MIEFHGDRIWDLLQSGGFIMIPLLALSLLLYQKVIALLIFVFRIRLVGLDDESASLSGISDSEGERGEWGSLLANYEESLFEFRQFIQTRLKFANSLLVSAPLLGLLGTVIGMLDTFRGLSLQAGHETQVMVADGVRRALITTETGLLIAVPALFLIYWVKRVSEKRELELLDSKIALVGEQMKGEAC